MPVRRDEGRAAAGPASLAGRPDDLWHRAELRLAIAIVVGTAALLLLVLGVAAERTHLLMLDFRDWQPLSSLSADPEAFHQSIQSRFPPQRPLRVTLQLERPPREDDFYAVVREIPVDDDRTYCLRFFTFSDYYRPTAGAIATFSVVVTVNGTPVSRFPIADRQDGELIVVEGVRPVEGEISVRFEVRAHVTRESSSWQRASKVSFEFMSIESCEARELSVRSSRPPQT